MECESLLLMWPLYTIPNSPNKGTHSVNVTVVMMVQNNFTIKKDNILPCPIVSFSLMLTDGIIRCDSRPN